MTAEDRGLFFWLICDNKQIKLQSNNVKYIANRVYKKRGKIPETLLLLMSFLNDIYGNWFAEIRFLVLLIM